MASELSLTVKVADVKEIRALLEALEPFASTMQRVSGSRVHDYDSGRYDDEPYTTRMKVGDWRKLHMAMLSLANAGR